MTNHKVTPFWIETMCMHCTLKTKHRNIGESHCETEWTDEGYDPPSNVYASDGHTFYSLICRACDQITIWHGFIPEWIDEDVLTEDDKEQQFAAFYKCIFPEVKLTRVWPYKVQRANIDEKILFFLDQAHKADSIALYNAAIMSFRSVLEAIVDIDGTTPHINEKGQFISLGTRISALTGQKPLPEWVRHLDGTSLKFIKDLGNESVHIRNLTLFNKEMSEAMRESIDIILQEFYRDTKSDMERANTKLRAAHKKATKVSK